ncbi:MAG TPA: CopD family protein [Moheibacter sp.]|nr:CopD family protein [Moheibacter sp.]
MSHHLLLIIHLLSAAVWIGGHLYLAACLLPGILRTKDAGRLLKFEKSFEPLGMPALLLLVVTGIWMSLQFGITWKDWFSFSSPMERVVSIKIILLLTTVLFAISAQTRVLPKLKKGKNRLMEMAVHILMVTLIGIAMLVLGTFLRYGGF